MRKLIRILTLYWRIKRFIREFEMLKNQAESNKTGAAKKGQANLKEYIHWWNIEDKYRDKIKLLKSLL